MNIADQGTREPATRRYTAVPRVLVFLTSTNPATGGQEVLLLKGAPNKRLWAGRYNGLGGHVEAGEDIYTAATRELAEEAGLHDVPLHLAGIINIDTGQDEQGPRPGVLVFVFTGETAVRTVHPSSEGEPTWVSSAGYADYPMVEDLYALLPRVLARRFFYAAYTPQADGTLAFAFREP